VDIHKNLAIGFDIGATKIAAALVSQDGEVISTKNQLTNPVSGIAAILDEIAMVINDWLEINNNNVIGVGIGIPGIVNPSEGLVVKAANLEWEGINFRDELSSRLRNKQEIWLQNDTNAEILGEYYFGAGRGYKNLVYLGIGTGLGSGVIIDGNLLTGDNNVASEIGHLVLFTDGRPCTCGLNGCIETIVSGRGVVDETIEKLQEGRLKTRLSITHELTSREIIEAAYDSDPLALEVISKLASTLGFVIAVYTAVFNPACVIIGGGIGRAGFDLLLPTIQNELVLRVPKSRYKNMMIKKSVLESSAIGASCLVYHNKMLV